MASILEKEIRDDVLQKLEDDAYVCMNSAVDVAFSLWQDENATGSITCSTSRSIQWIKTHFEELADYAEEIEDIAAENPFKEPEAFQVVATIFITESLVQSVWEDGMSKEELQARLAEID